METTNSKSKSFEQQMLSLIRRTVMGTMISFTLLMLLAPQLLENLLSTEMLTFWGTITLIVFLGGVFTYGQHFAIGWAFMTVAILTLSTILVPWIEVNWMMWLNLDFWVMGLWVLLAVALSDGVTRMLFGALGNYIDDSSPVSFDQML